MSFPFFPLPLVLFLLTEPSPCDTSGTASFLPFARAPFAHPHPSALLRLHPRAWTYPSPSRPPSSVAGTPSPPPITGAVVSFDWRDERARRGSWRRMRARPPATRETTCIRSVRRKLTRILNPREDSASAARSRDGASSRCVGASNRDGDTAAYRCRRAGAGRASWE